MSLFRLLLAFHLIAVISWMAGILYLIRLFVYHAMETELSVKARFQTMERRAYRIITLPALLVSLGLGLAMIGLSPGLIDERWFQIKVVCATVLIGITLRAATYLRRFAEGKPTPNHKFFRWLNEIPTLLMIVIVLLVILRPALTW